MSDFAGKIVSVLLAFLMLVLAPLTITYLMDQLHSETLILNEVVQFLDKITDKCIVTTADLDDLYFGVNSTGGSYDVTVKRFVRATKQVLVDENDPSGEETTETVYLSSDDLTFFNRGDVIKVTVKEIGTPPAKRLIWSLLRVDSGRFNFSLAGTVR